MLKLTLDAVDDLEPVELEFEHSLVSLSKWEAIYEKPFFSKDPRTPEEGLDYIRFMLLTPDPPEGWIDRIGVKTFTKINDYINSKQTATTFRDDPNQRPSREVVTSELIYSWMIAFKIPFSPSEEWHLNRLMTLIRIRGIQSTKQKPMSRQARQDQYRQLNEQRKAKLGTSG